MNREAGGFVNSAVNLDLRSNLFKMTLSGIAHILGLVSLIDLFFSFEN